MRAEVVLRMVREWVLWKVRGLVVEVMGSRGRIEMGGRGLLPFYGGGDGGEGSGAGGEVGLHALEGVDGGAWSQ